MNNMINTHYFYIYIIDIFVYVIVVRGGWFA